MPPIDGHFDPTISLRGFSKFGGELHSKTQTSEEEDRPIYCLALAVNNLAVSILVASGNADRKIPVTKRMEAARA